ncbi:MAG: hypothetical protein Q7S27_03685 [Nanoarchaeota archaeon]|nr:hypothetical protein [Nanoarchaeota archaeon]
MVKKKEEINVEELDINHLLPETVATSRLGRALASLGSILTGREKHDARLVYLVMKAGKKYSEKLPLIARLVKEKELKKYSPSQAIDWFAQNYPKEARPLLKKLEQKYRESKQNLNYGLKGKKDLPDKLYLETLSTVLNITEDRARTLYYGIIQPYLEKEEEESKLVSLTIKEAKNK